MNISRYISWPTFIVSFIIGLIYAAIATPDTKTVFIFPTPENYTHTLFQDRANQCFQMIPTKVQCPFNPETIKPQD